MTKKQKVVFAVVAAVIVLGIFCLTYAIILFMGQESLPGREKHTTN